jgi:hypothetical protein
MQRSPMTFNACFSPNRSKVDNQCLIPTVLIGTTQLENERFPNILL